MRWVTLALLLGGGLAEAAPPDLGVAPEGQSQPERQRLKKRLRDGEPPVGDDAKVKPKEPAESRKVDR